MSDPIPGPVRDSLLSRFDTVAAARPAAVAVRTGHVRVSYATLAEASHLLAKRLTACARERSGPVAVLREAGPGQVCAALAAMRCGRPYLPIDPSYPRQRVERILGDAAPAVLIAGSDAELAAVGAVADAQGLLASLPVERGRWGESAPVTDRDAYVIYTSGSSGTPKGVVIGHHSIVSLLDEFATRRRLAPGSRHSACASPGFDASVWETWTSLSSGGELCVMPDGCRWDATAFVDWLADEDIAGAYVPAAFLPALAQASDLGIDLRSLRRMMVGAEPISRDVLGAVKRALPDLMLLNAYGPTEATVCCLLYEASADDSGPQRAPIGTAIRGAELVIAPAHGRPGLVLPAGPSGELHVGGTPVGRYLHPEEGQDAAFYPRTVPNGRPRAYYRTGDLVRRDATGSRTFLGRVDDMLKVRGYRVAPQEIEGLLLRLPGIAEAVVVKQTPTAASGTDGERLVAHIVAATGVRLGVLGIQRRLREQLPWYAVPHCLIRQEPLPLTEHGKIDRHALAAQGYAPGTGRSPKTASAAEHPLLGLWRSALGPAADPRTSFLDNGGDSLTAGRLAAMLAGRTGRQVRMIDVLLADSLQALEQSVPRGPSARGPVVGRQHALLTPAQQGLIWEEQLSGIEAAYAESCLFVFSRAVPVDRLRTAVTTALGRHPAIGGRVEGTADPSGAVLHLGRTVDVRTHRLDALPTDLTALADQLRREPLDLQTGPLGRARLIATPEGCVALLLTLHHVVCDTWSLHLLLRDIADAFAGVGPPPRSAATACDYAAAQTAARSRAAVARRATALAGTAASGRREPFPSPSPQVSTLRTAIDAQTVGRIKATAARADVTVFAVVCAGFESALTTVLDPGRFLYATPVAHRENPDFGQVAGCLINTVPIASSVSSVPPGDTGQLLTAVGRQVIAALSASHLPYPDLLSALRQRGVHQPPHRFLLIHDSPLRLHLGDQEPTGICLPPINARSDVYLSLNDCGERFDVHLHTDAARVDTRTARSILSAFERSLWDVTT